jgi:hypothetical protein
MARWGFREITDFRSGTRGVTQFVRMEARFPDFARCLGHGRTLECL